MRRLFIIRKDLNLSPGKLAAMVGHCAEGYWMQLLLRNEPIPDDIREEYVNGIFRKVICGAKDLSHLMKVEATAKELGLVEGMDYGFIDDWCFTEITPEFTDAQGVGRCRVGVWFKPLPDETSKKLSRKYNLY